MAQTFNLGQVAIVSRGDWVGGTAYKELNAVSHLGGAWLCIKAHSASVEPGVTSGWATYWMNIARGMKSYAATVNSGTATVTITFTDGATYSFSYSTAAIGDAAVGTNQLAPSSVTTPKLADGSVTPAKISGINTDGYPWSVYVQNTVPTTSSPNGIYLVYE